VDDVSTDRLAGTNRYGTANAVSAEPEFAGATTAILATGETFPDALAASGLAGANAPAPIILTQSNTFTAEAQQALDALTSLTDVIIVGGTAAVSSTVEDAVEAEGYTVTRIAGADRYATAAAIAGQVGTIGTIDNLDSALIASGTGFADALAGGPVSYAAGLPILLVTADSIPAATSAALTDLGIEQAIVLGGTAAVSDAVADDLEAATGNPVVRVAGTNRFGTGAAVGEFAIAELGWAPEEVLLANGLNFPDALAAGPLGGEREAPLVLTASLPAESAQFLDDHSDTIERITVLGGTGVNDEATVTDAEEAAESTDNDQGAAQGTKTTRPEVTTATIQTIVAANATVSKPAGTYVTFCYDEAVTGALPVPGLHKVWNGDGTFKVAEVANVTQADNKCVEARFGSTAGDSSLDTPAEAAVLTVGTVAKGAATGTGGAPGDTSTEGDAPLTPAGATTTPPASGVTGGSDLVTVGNFRAGFSEDVSAVDFTFDEAAFTNNINGYHLVTTNNDLIQCTGPAEDSTTASGGTVPGGEGTTTHTVLCNEPPLGATFSTSSVVRGYVDANTVDDADTFAAPGNPLQAAEVSAAGNSDGPSLDLLVFAPDATAGVDIAAFIFSEGVQAAPLVAANYGIFDTDGNTMAPAAVSRSTENSSAVSAVYADNTLSSAVFVGGNVMPGAATDLQGEVNRGDEVGASPSAGPSRTSGKTDGPDLEAVVLNPGTSPFGNPTYTATFDLDEDTFDNEDPGGGVDATRMSGLHLYLPDGIQLNCTMLSATSNDTVLMDRTEDNDDKITCIQFFVDGGAQATVAQIGSATVGTVEAGAIGDEAVGGDSNPEGHSLTTGGTTA
jgi:putative cell wall-binding protein